MDAATFGTRFLMAKYWYFYLTFYYYSYGCGWYRFPLKTQFLVRFMMIRSAMPCQLTAGSILVMNFESCGAVSVNLYGSLIFKMYIKNNKLFEDFKNRNVIFYGRCLC